MTVAAARALAVAAQRYAARRRRATSEDVAATVSRLSCVQLDSISAVERSHRLVLSARAGEYARGTVSELLRAGRLFEQWAHEACLIPIADYPLFKRRMAGRRIHHWFGPVIDSDPALADRVRAAIRERGPLGARDFEGKGGGLWEWKPAKRMLEALWTAGELAIAGRRGFERLYDLPERVIPAEYLEAPVPSEAEYLRGLVLRAVRARGALTERGVVDHYRIAGGTARIRPYADELVRAGALERVAVDDGGAPLLVFAGLAGEIDRPTGSVLLSPFDNLLWDRSLVERLFGFRHVIEVYKRPGERRYGYYVLPLLRDDRLVARADLKADRKADVLRVLSFRPEPGVRASAALDEAFTSALGRVARAAGVRGVEREQPARLVRPRA